MKRQTKAMLMAVTMAASAMTACVPKATTETTAAATEAAGAAAGETQAEFQMNKEGLPIVNEPITYEIAAATRKNKDFKDLEYFQKTGRIHQCKNQLDDDCKRCVV